MLDIAHILFHCIIVGAKTQNAFHSFQYEVGIFSLLLTTSQIGHFSVIARIQPFSEPLTGRAQFRAGHSESIKTQAFCKSFKVCQLLIFF